MTLSMLRTSKDIRLKSIAGGGCGVTGVTSTKILAGVVASITDPPLAQCLAGQFVRALIDFAGTAEDELSFGVGAVIHVLGRRAVGEVDDGWVEGELVPLTDAETSTPPARGVFPSMLVEIVPPEEIWRRRLSACRPRKSVISFIQSLIEALINWTFL